MPDYELVRFECYHCIHCCFFVRDEETPILLSEEVEVLTNEALKRGFKIRLEPLGGNFFRWLIRGFCPFYNIRTRRCLIHDKKPLACRIYPLLLNIRTGDVHVSTACDWVIKNLRSTLIHNVDEVFSEELMYVKILYRKILTLTSR